MRAVCLAVLVAFAAWPFIEGDWPEPVGLTPRAAIAKLAYNAMLDLPHIHHHKVWLTAYCSCPICTGASSPNVGGHGLTKIGLPPQAYYTVAADPNVYPLGTVLELNGLVRVRVEDTGSLVIGPHLDVYVGSSKHHETAVDFGVRRFVDVVRVASR